MIALLGKGSFGEVYECEDKSDNQVYAVKVLNFQPRSFQRIT